MGFSLPINEFFWPVASAVAAAFIIYVFNRIFSREPAQPVVVVGPVNGPVTPPLPPDTQPVHAAPDVRDPDIRDFERLQIAETDDMAIVVAYIEKYPNSLYAEKARQRLKAKDWIEIAVGAPPNNRWFLPGAGQKQWFQDFENGPEMVVVPAGSFKMGSPPGEEGPHEGPQRDLTIAECFAVGRFAVSFDEWDAFASDTRGWFPDDRGWGRGKRPVIGVNWENAQQYVAWLRRKSGKKYRLLSEAEWEYVCRAGSTGPYWWGSRISTALANYEGQMTEPVDKFDPNDWGLYQVHGNVWEWVEDCWHNNYGGAPLDGSAWTTDCDSDEHVYRGGSWKEGPYGLRAARRWGGVNAINTVGFRVARTITP